MSRVTGAVVAAGIVLLSGVGTYSILAKWNGPDAASLTHCAPANSPVCLPFAFVHDLHLVVPVRAAQAGTSVPFSVSAPAGEQTTSFTFDFGDGVTATGPDPHTTHRYDHPGAYIVSVSGLVRGVVHDNARSLTLISVVQSYVSPSATEAPAVSGVIVANSTTKVAPTAILRIGDNLSVSGAYLGGPTDPTFTSVPPFFAPAAHAIVADVVATNRSVSEHLTFWSPGVFTATFVGSARDGRGMTAFENYTWTVYVAATGVHAGSGSVNSLSPHKNLIIAYEEQPGGAVTLDPAIAYDANSNEPILNVYQTLVIFNGTDLGSGPSNFVPELATCVPGTIQCTQLYGAGHDLTASWSAGENYTFVISPDASFYDPSTKAHWGVWPSDVLFSVARTLGFSTLPCWGCHVGWILAQSLLPQGNGSWDGGAHWPGNNTPAAVYSAVTVNDSGCPASPANHGCVTFHVAGLGHPWPFFLQLLADPEGSSIVPCGWVSSTASPGASGGQPIPGWPAVTDAGDHPCLLPGGARSSSDPGFVSAVAAMSPTLWDGWEATNTGSTPVGSLTTAMVGSGPYYLSSYSPGNSYTLQASPAYAQNTQCAGVGCEPGVRGFASTVQVTWESSALPGEQAYASGVADFATIPSTDDALLVQLAEQGRVDALNLPTLGIDFFPYDMDFSPAAASGLSTQPVTVPGDWFVYLGMRQFFSAAFPYATEQATIDTRDGIQSGFLYGGVIPQGMGPYYPTNISWPTGDPSSAVGSASWWWAQITNRSSPWYDPETESCTTANPCRLPIVSTIGTPDADLRVALWVHQVATLTGGRVELSATDIGLNDEIAHAYDPPGTGPMAVYHLGWIPDYPDPTDYMQAMYVANSTYTNYDSVQPEMARFNASTCPQGLTALSYYSRLTVGNFTSQACEGAAYASMGEAMAVAANLPEGPQRILYYNMIEHVANQLALYMYDFQIVNVVSHASWIDGASIDNGFTLGGNFSWWSVAGNGLL